MTGKSKAQRMTDLIENCSGYTEALKLFRQACQAQWAEGERPAEFVAFEAALYDAEEVAEALDATA